MIQIISETSETHPERAYKAVTFHDGRHETSLFFSYNQNFEFQYVTVLVKNAAHRAWKGIGKTFWSLDDAISNYKTPAIKEMLRYFDKKDVS